ncbi:MAG: FHA domain-containing protein, partial [Pirellulaceae bacterium]
MASLFVIQGRDQGRRFDLNQEVVSLGRDSANVIQLHDSEVSRRHAELRFQDGRYQLVDLSSSNGTFVNDQLVTEHELESGDRVLIGRTLLIFTRVEESSSVNLASDVDIVRRTGLEANSRIVRSMGQAEGSQILVQAEAEDSPWLARARSNLQIMYRTALAVSHTLDIDQLLHRITDLIFEWV